jgi:hypothetical protein
VGEEEEDEEDDETSDEDSNQLPTDVRNEIDQVKEQYDR